MIYIVEVGEVGVYLHDPVWNRQTHGADKESAPPFRQEWFQLHPCDDIVQHPRCIQEDGCDRQPPAVNWLVEEYEEA